MQQTFNLGHPGFVTSRRIKTLLANVHLHMQQTHRSCEGAHQVNAKSKHRQNGLATPQQIVT